MPASDIWQHASAVQNDGMRQTSMHSPSSHTPTTVIYDQGSQKIGPVTDAEVYKLVIWFMLLLLGVGVYGWRKRCLYFFILLLTVIIVANLALTVWIMSVLDFTSTGMGALKITDDGIRVAGRAEFDKPVHFRQVGTAAGVPLSIDGDRGVYLNARNTTGQVTSRLSLSHDGLIQAVCDRFEVRNADRELLFFASKNEVGVRVPNLKNIDEAGAVFEGSIKTTLIRPESDEPLRLESPTRGLIVDASQDIELLSRAGDITTMSLLDTRFEAKKGEIRFSSENIFIDGLKEGASFAGQPQYQVCICTNGRLFLARGQAETDCRADSHICTN